MKKIYKLDAYIALILILLLMVSLLGMNIAYVLYSHKLNIIGTYPVSKVICKFIFFNSDMGFGFWNLVFEICWWSHILLIYIFANYLPYSKHFHVFMSVPNVFFSSLDPLGKLPNMDNVTKEVKLMLNPETTFSAPA